MSETGYGRGGRGAALLQALNAPVRRPGASQEDTPTTSATSAPTPAPAASASKVIWHC